MYELSTEYVAGLFDGEGCFVITKAVNGAKVRRQSFYYVATGAIEIREEFIVDLLILKYGGSKTFKTSKNPKHSNTYRWKVSGQTLKKFCNGVLPHLRIKHRQAQTVIDFIELREGRNTSPLTDSERMLQEELREVIMFLNKTGVSNIQHRQLIPNHVKAG